MPLVSRQVALADLLILNKEDLVTSDQLSAVTAALTTINAAATVITTTRCRYAKRVWGALVEASQGSGYECGELVYLTVFHVVNFLFAILFLSASSFSLAVSMREVSCVRYTLCLWVSVPFSPKVNALFYLCLRTFLPRLYVYI